MPSASTITLSIRRFKPGRIDPARFENFTVPREPGWSLLDALEHIRRTRTPDLLFRHSCHHSACGTCAVMVDGRPQLACTTGLNGLNHAVVTVEPLAGMPVVADLVVDMRAFHADFDEHWSERRTCLPPDSPRTPAGIGQLQRMEDCIACGCCTAACPVSGPGADFMGPAALAAIANELPKSPADRKALLARVGGKRGQALCRRHLACSRVCPTGVYPARRIADLRRMLASTGKTLEKR